jgi:hypothetical protein
LPGTDKGGSFYAVVPPSPYAKAPAEWAGATKKADWRVLASAPHLQGIENSIAKFFGGERKKLVLVGPALYAIERRQGELMPSIQVYKQKGRWYFATLAT